MYISLDKILNHENFKEAKVIAGKNGLTRPIKRISVFDCPIFSDIYESGIVEEGDFFLTGLRQFENDIDFLELIKILNELKGSGLCIVADNKEFLITNKIVDFCNNFKFPLINLSENVPYALIMDTMNKFISIENLNAINELKIDRIVNGELSERERLELLYSINSNIEKYIQIINLHGNIKSQIGDDELNVKYLNKKEDIFINNNRIQLLIISSDNLGSLKSRVNVATQQLLDAFKDVHMGISRPYLSKEIKECIKEAKAALKTAKTINTKVQEYEPLSAFQLLIPLKEGREIEDFYNAYVEKLKIKISEEHLEDFLNTIKAFVINKGEYKEVAKNINQHENTVRYRINKVKNALELEDDIIKFYETISLAVKIELFRER